MGTGIILPKWGTWLLGGFGVAALTGMFWSGSISARLSADITHLSIAVSGLRGELMEQRKTSGDALQHARSECLARHHGMLETIRQLSERVARSERE